MRRVKKIFPILLAYLLLFPGSLLNSREQELSYEVSVSVIRVPFVAVDKKGTPVFDLKKDELALYVNGQPVPIHSLQRMVLTSASPKEQQAQHIKPPPRLIVIIIDTVFNSAFGLNQSKQVTRKLIENASSADRFLLAEIQLGGLKYITGPEPAGEPLLRRLKKIRKSPQSIRLLTPTRNERIMSGRTLGMYGNRNARRISVSMYMDAFKQLKNALHIYDGPKLTYLFSEGFAGHMHSYISSYKIVMKDIENAVHDGGSVLKRVGVKGMRSNRVPGIARRLTRSTSAYYDLFFTPTRESGSEMKVNIRCNRQGVRINAAGHIEMDKPYREMSKLRKKTFAIGVATGLNWKRQTGHIKRVAYEKKETQNPGHDTRYTIQIQIPPQMRDRGLDMYILRFDDRYEDVDIVLNTRKVKDVETVTLQRSKDKKNLYFVFVDPGTGFCIFNKVLAHTGASGEFTEDVLRLCEPLVRDAVLAVKKIKGKDGEICESNTTMPLFGIPPIL